MSAIFATQTTNPVAKIFRKMSKKAITAIFLGTAATVYSLAIRNQTYLTNALLWTAASCAIGYFTRRKAVQRPSNILENSELEKVGSSEFQSEVYRLSDDRAKNHSTTNGQRRRFYYCMCVYHLFSAEEKRHLSAALSTLKKLRPYMEESSKANQTFYPDLYMDYRNDLPPDILRHRDFIRWQALKEFQDFGEIPEKTYKWDTRFDTAIERVFKAIQDGILEDSSVQERWKKDRGDSEKFTQGDDDAFLYFQRKFFHTPRPANCDTSNPWNRFYEVAPIHSHVSHIRSTQYDD